jgi:hypothetical protein
LSRFVLDANILLSALAAHPGAPSAVLLNGVHDGQAEAVTCPAATKTCSTTPDCNPQRSTHAAPANSSD